MPDRYEIITFYEFKRLAEVADLSRLRERLRDIMAKNEIRGTVILAEEGFNSTVCGTPDAIRSFVKAVNEVLDTTLDVKSSFHDKIPFRKIDVKIKPEIVTLKKVVDISLGTGTHVEPDKWNEIIADQQTIVLDARNDYEYRNGTFLRALNPGTEKFSDLPGYIEENFDPSKHKNIAMFCTGGIRCEKFAPYMKQLGFENIYQLNGGILRYLELTNREESLWKGECFVFDDRKTVDECLEKGKAPDMSQLPAAERPGGTD